MWEVFKVDNYLTGKDAYSETKMFDDIDSAYLYHGIYPYNQTVGSDTVEHRILLEGTLYVFRKDLSA